MLQTDEHRLRVEVLLLPNGRLLVEPQEAVRGRERAAAHMTHRTIGSIHQFVVTAETNDRRMRDRFAVYARVIIDILEIRNLLGAHPIV